MKKPVSPYVTVHGLKAVCVDYRLRPAQSHDAAWLWQLANDPEVRRVAFHQEPIPWESHLAWYAEKLSNPNCFIAILETDNRIPLGQIRFDHGLEGLEVDLAIIASHRGRGIGRRLLSQGLQAAANRWPSGTRVAAGVIEGNERSERLFETSGFVVTAGGVKHGRSFRTYERRL